MSELELARTVAAWSLSVLIWAAVATWAFMVVEAVVEWWKYRR